VKRSTLPALVSAMVFIAAAASATGDAGRTAAEDWPQFKFDAGHSGNVPDRTVAVPLELAAATALTDAIFTAPAVSGDRVFVVDGAGVCFCLDGKTLDVIWKVRTRGGKASCSNVSSPAVIDGFVHFGTTAGFYYVLKADDGSVVQELNRGEPVFSAPVAANGRVYCATLGSRVFALTPEGALLWEWDFVTEHLGFHGDRWSGEAWAARGERVTWREQFCCSRDIAVHGKTLVVPAGGTIVWLEDAGDSAKLRHVHAPKESPATLGLCLDAEGTVYRQWYRRDNTGSVAILKLTDDGTLEESEVAGTKTSYRGAESMSFSSVSVRGKDVYRARPEERFGLCLHRPGSPPLALSSALSITAPILLADKVLFADLHGGLHVVPLDGGDSAKAWTFQTPSGKAISAPPAVSNGRVYFGSEDGYVYALAPPDSGAAAAAEPTPPLKDLELWRIRSPLEGPRSGAEHDWDTNFGDAANTNANDQGLRPPFKVKWIRRFEGTIKHFSSCGGGRMYTHTAEGQIFAVEQETGRLLWRSAYPGVHVSYTAPLYHEERLYVPQAGLENCFLRCLDAATGKLLWDAPFSGSPSWNRQQPPIIAGDLVIYLFSTGSYTPEKWLFEHQSTFGFPEDQKPLLRAWNRMTGEEVWTREFSEHGAGGDDAGMCLMDGVLYYSCYFGTREPPGITAAVEPATGKVLWTNTSHAVHSGCAVSGKDGRLYLGGYSPLVGKDNRVLCLDAADGTLVWESEPVKRAIHVITIRDDTLFTHAQYEDSYLLDRKTGAILSSMNKGYFCTRFTVSEPFLLAANMDIWEPDRDFTLVSTGPALDVIPCVGAAASNGRLFFTANGGALQASLVCGEEAKAWSAPWEIDEGK